MGIEIKNISLIYNKSNKLGRFLLNFVIKHELIHKRICKSFIKESKPKIKIYYVSKYDFGGACQFNYPEFLNKNELYIFKLIFINFIHLIWDFLCGFVFLNSLNYSLYKFLLNNYLVIKLILRKEN